MLASSYQFQSSLGCFVSFNGEREKVTSQSEACAIEMVDGDRTTPASGLSRIKHRLDAADACRRTRGGPRGH
jgi:hypothetical protein